MDIPASNRPRLVDEKHQIAVQLCYGDYCFNKCYVTYE